MESIETGATQLLAASDIIQSLLASHSVDDIPLGRGRVIEVDSKMPAIEAFKVLTTNRILSAPVWVEETQRYHGFLDVRDLVKYAVFAYDSENSARHISSRQNSLVDDLVSQANIHVRSNINVPYLSAMRPFKPVVPGTSLAVVAQRLADGAHRVPVVHPDTKRVLNVISQSALLTFLHTQLSSEENDIDSSDASAAASPTAAAYAKSAAGAALNAILLKNLFKPRAANPVSLVQAPVHAVRDDDSALFMFRVMAERNLSGVAVVNKTGVLVQNTSSSDLKLWLQQGQTLRQPIQDFLAGVRNSQRQLAPQTRFPVVVVRLNDSVGTLIRRLAKTRLHRVFLVDGAFRPLGVVSISDILRAVTGHNKAKLSLWLREQQRMRAN